MERGQRHPIFPTRSLATPPTRPKCWQDWATEDETVCHLPEKRLCLSLPASFGVPSHSVSPQVVALTFIIHLFCVLLTFHLQV